MTYGIGRTSAGTGPFGLGTPVAVPAATTNVLKDALGVPQGSRYINPVTRDYAYDTDGNAVGMNSVQQRVQLAVSTDRGTSTARDLGNRLKTIQRITDGFSKEVDTMVRECVADLLADGSITIEAIRVERLSGLSSGAFVRMKWRDNTTGENLEEIIQ